MLDVAEWVDGRVKLKRWEPWREAWLVPVTDAET